jgi:N-acyl-D-amino-acid deacylase
VRRDSTLDGQIAQIFEMYRGGDAQMVYHKMDEPDVERILREPFTMVASDAGPGNYRSGVPHPRGYGNNARVLGRYVRERGIISLEDAIRKMTSLPALTFGFRDRGLVREGYVADLLLIDEAVVGDRATFEEPHQYAAGFDYVLVNGKRWWPRAKLRVRCRARPSGGSSQAIDLPAEAETIQAKT